MPIPIATPIKILPEVAPLLKRIINSGKTEKRIVERARFIVRMGEGIPNTRIAKEFGVQNNTIRKWRERWLEGEASLHRIVAQVAGEKEQSKALKEHLHKILQDKERPGTPMKYTAEQYCQVLQVTLEPPSQSGRPINDWSSWELAEEVNKRGICEKISASQVGRFLKKRETLNRTKAAIG